MSSESSVNSYAHHYLAPQPEVDEETWLWEVAAPQSDDLALMVSGPMLAISWWAHPDDYALSAAADRLPFAAQTFDQVVIKHPLFTQSADDPFPIVQSAARVLKSGGVLIVQAINLPDDDRAAHYINAFYRLRDRTHTPGYAPYLWQGMLLDAGLELDRIETLRQPRRLLDWAQDCSPVVVERLQVMLKQAPPPVADHLRPFAIGTADAMFTHSLLAIIGRKP